MNILIIEDEPMIARFLSRIAHDIEVVNIVKIAHSYQEGYDLMMSGTFDFLLVDVCLGSDEWDGLTLCKIARKHFSEVTIIIITSLHSLNCLSQAFSIGVNDYMTKPFHPGELRLRMLRWLGASPRLHKMTIQYHGLEYMPEEHEFLYDGKKIDLSKRNKDLLLIFLKKPENLMNPIYLKEKFWGDITDRPRNIRSSIQSLRNSLPKECKSWIKNQWGEGYILRKK